MRLAVLETEQAMCPVLDLHFAVIQVRQISGVLHYASRHLVLVERMDACMRSEVESVCSSAVKTVVDSGCSSEPIACQTAHCT